MSRVEVYSIAFWKDNVEYREQRMGAQEWTEVSVVDTVTYIRGPLKWDWSELPHPSYRSVSCWQLTVKTLSGSSPEWRKWLGEALFLSGQLASDDRSMLLQRLTSGRGVGGALKGYRSSRVPSGISWGLAATISQLNFSFCSFLLLSLLVGGDPQSIILLHANFHLKVCFPGNLIQFSRAIRRL